jgi:predicted HTH transcriptional regulator
MSFDGGWLAFVQAASLRAADESSEEMLKLLQARPGLSARAPARRLAITPRAVEKRLNRLKRESRLFRAGPAGSGHWKAGVAS